MVRLELNELFVLYEDERVPIGIPYSAEAAVTVIARGRINGAVLDRKYAYLSVSGVVGEAEVVLGTTLGTVASGERKSYDIKSRLAYGECEVRLLLSAGTTLTAIPTILSFNTAAIEGVQVTERVESHGVTLDIKLRTLGSSDGVKAIATLVSGAGQIYYGGITRGYGRISVKDPLYWWPRGLGVPNLYRLTVNLYGESDIEDTEELFVGLRSAIVFRERDVRLSFNDTAFVPMGAKYTLPTGEGAYEKIIEEIKKLARGGANAVYLDSAAGYIPRVLLDTCDREGLVVFREISDSSAIGAELERVSTHPSLSYLIISEGDSQDALYTAARGAAPDAALILARECDGALIESYPSLPEDKTLRALGDPRERNPLSRGLLSLGGEAYQGTLIRAFDEYLFPSGSGELGYLTRLLQAREVEEKIAAARLKRGAGLSFAIYSELSSREIAPSSAAIDAFGREKLLYFRAAHAHSPVYATIRRTEWGADITVINYRRTELSGRLYFRVLDTSNNLVYNYAEEISVAPVGEITVRAPINEYIEGREEQCYLEYGISSHDAQYSDTALFVSPKDFRFELPNIRVRVDGAGEDFFITVSSDKFTSGVEIVADGADLSLSDSGFDITSPAPVKIAAKLKSGRISAAELEARIRINCLNTIGFEN